MSEIQREISLPVIAPNDVEIRVDSPVDPNFERNSESPKSVEASSPKPDVESPRSSTVSSVKDIGNVKEEPKAEVLLKDLLPWIIAAAIGLILLIVAVILMATRQSRPFTFPYDTQDFNIPNYQGSIRVKSVDGQDLRYISELRQIGSQASRALRYKLEPKLKYIYGNASLPVDHVVVIAFKYGAAGQAPTSELGRSILGRTGNDGDEHSIVARHWVYLKRNITKSVDELESAFVGALSKVPGIDVDETSFELESLENMTRIEAIVALAQAGFFNQKYGQLDLDLLNIFGLTPIIDIQTDDDDGLCWSLTHPNNGKVSPQTCLTSVNTYAKMTCSFACDEGFELEGSPKRVCMASGLWSGEPVKCHKKCSPLTLTTAGSIHPQSCLESNSSSGQMCFTECLSENYKMIFKSPITVEKKLNFPGSNIFDFDNYALKKDKVDPLSDARSYIQECRSDGQWSGKVGTCKTRCKKLAPPLNGIVSPSSCLTDPIEGDECSVSCIDSFAMADGTDYKRLTCDVSGVWMGEVLPCQKLCEMHSVNNTLSMAPAVCESNAYEGLTCQYSCDQGSILVGPSERTCSNGLWSTEEPRCVATCPPLANLDNGIFMSNAGPCSDVASVEGTECVMNCEAGNLALENSTVCLASGEWSRQNITCQKMCPPLYHDEHGNWSQSTCTGFHYAQLESCVLSCNPGFILDGSGILSCSVSGTWNDTQGQCRANCPALSAPTNGYIENKTLCVDGSTVAGTTCEFGCLPSYKISGDRILTCGGGWSASPPTCTFESQYHMIQESENTVLCLIATDYGTIQKMEEDIASVDVCESSSASWVVQDSKIIHAVYRTCLTAVPASTLLSLEDCDPSNGWQIFSGGIGRSVKVNESEMYVTTGYRTIRQPQLDSNVHSFMEERIRWRFRNTDSGETMNLFGLSNGGACMGLTLNPSIVLQTVSCANPTQSNGTLCDVQCPGSTLSDRSASQARIECVNGEWLVDLDIYCKPITPQSCAGISVGAEVVVTPTSCMSTSAADSSCEMDCTNSTVYHLDGPTSVSCMENGRWFPSHIPECNPRCDNIQLPDQGYFITGDSTACTAHGGLPATGSVCALACQDGFALIGESILTCTKSGVWNAPSPKCVALCDPHVNIEHGSLKDCSAPMHNGKYTEDTICTLTCEAGYQPDAIIPTIVCGYGDWNLASMGTATCVPVCPGFVVQPNSWVSFDCRSGVVSAGTDCIFSCDDGYGLNTPSTTYQESLTRTCQKDGTWTGSIASCSRRCPRFSEPETLGAYYDPPECQIFPQRPNTKCTLMCPGGNAVHGGPDTLICNEDGSWSSNGSFGMCSPVCEALPKILHAEIKPMLCTEGFVKADTECMISCPVDMERVGSALRKCVVDEDSPTGSRWTGSFDPTSCRTRCPPLALLANSRVFPTNCQFDARVEGDTCSFDCDPGFLLQGSPQLHCTSSGRFSDSEPSCYKPCPLILVPNGDLKCDESFGIIADGLGYVFKPGAKCNYFCETGFAANEDNQVICNNEGLWSPEPFCSPVSEAFPIIQKIGEEMVCLKVSAMGNDGTLSGSDWHLTTTENSTTGCESAGNNALWLWYGQSHIKHAETGLCLTAEAAMADSLIYMQHCDIDNRLQKWNCDAEHPYRFLLKESDLSIDTVYRELGPLLQSWTHSQTYWITYNSLLDAVGTICSYKVLGACPPINKNFMKASPEVCTSENIKIWQQCAVSCENGSDFDGSASIVECQPTGEWKSLEEMFCRQHCPPLPIISNGEYAESECSSANSKHQTECKLTCGDGFILSNNMESENYVCNDGEWSGELGISCEDRCVRIPKAPENGKVNCVGKSCTITCNLGYTLDGGDSQFQCNASLDYVEVNNITCKEEFQFQMKPKSVVFSSTMVMCITARVSGDQTDVVVAACLTSDLKQFWRWDADDTDQEYSMLQNIGTDLCLASTSDDSWAHIMLKTCDKTDSLQQWTCHDYHNPGRFGLATNPRTYVDVGSIHMETPPVLRNDDLHLKSADWIADNLRGNLGFICSSRQTGSCPTFPLVTMTGAPDICGSATAVPDGTECILECANSSFAFPDDETEHMITCDGGNWDQIPRCVATREDSNCNQITVPRFATVSPPECDIDHLGVLLTGTSCIFTCEPGYILNGTSELVCEGELTMLGSPPQCLAYCPGLEQTSGVNVNDMCSSVAVLAGTTCTMTCDDGYVATDGAPSSWFKTCSADGTWDGRDYYCVAMCPKLSDTPFNSTSVADDLENVSLYRRSITSTACADSTSISPTLCEFSCPERNYTMEGPKSILCEGNGLWSEQTPLCKRVIHCPKFDEGILDVKYSPEPDAEGEFVVAGTIAKLSCHSGRTLKGGDVRKCGQSGAWSGDEEPVCISECPALEPLYGFAVQPPECKAPSANNTMCQYTCASENGTLSQNVVCYNGQWEDISGRCSDSSAASEVTNNTMEFMMITHNPEGCLSVADGTHVLWLPREECDPSQPANKWKWADGRQLVSTHKDLCLQPVDENEGETSLGVGSCDTDFRVGCGSPNSAYQKYHLFASSDPRWRMSFNMSNSGSPYSIVMMKTEFTGEDVDVDGLEGIEVFANTDVANPRTTDRTICSYMCGGQISPNDDSETRLIMTPGFVAMKGYPVNSYCEWTFNGLGKVIVLRLQEIDIHSSDYKECSPDCVQIFEGNAEGGTVSEHVTSYSGNDIYKQGALEIKSISPSVSVVFRGTSGGPGRGFSMEYHFQDPPPALAECGTRQEYDAIMNKTSTSEIDESAEYRGQSADLLKWPWLVSVREVERGSLRAYHRCTGVLVGSKVVLTAAHCIRFILSSTINLIDIGIGFALQNEMDEVMRKSSSSEPVYHIYYGYDSMTRYGDVALFNLHEAVTMSDSLLPICLPLQGYKIHLPTSECYSAGWSSPTTGIRLNHIKDYKVNVQASSWCKDRLGLDDEVKFACAENVYIDVSGKREKDESDPLMCFFNGNWYLAGLRSYTHVGMRGTYRLYTEVHEFTDWITDTRDKIGLFDTSQGSSLLQ